MMKLAIFLASLDALTAASCDNLRVNTKSGPIVGVERETFPNKVPYISYKGIPYAEPPINELRFKVPKAVKPWTDPLITTDKFQPSCLWTGTTEPSGSQANQSENCLYLNIYTPVMNKIKRNKKLSVLMNIHGGGFAEGDGSDANYGPDFIVQHNVILVSINYRLGPFGFANFELEGYTGNMGLKDQRMALKWVKENIVYFGGTAVHFHVLSDSCEYIKRAISWSGNAFSTDAYYEENNHIDLLTETFKNELGNQTSKEDLLNFMINAPADVIAKRTPQRPFKGIFNIYFTAVVENKSLADDPFLTEKPHEIYAKNQFSSHCRNVEVSFGVTSAEFLLYLNFSNLYDWIEPLKNNSLFGLPYYGLNITENDKEYKAIQEDIKQFYFGNGEIQATPERLNQYVQMGTDINFLPQLYEGIRLHSNVSPTYCNIFDISLNMNIVKVPLHLEFIDGMGHFEDIQYLFKAAHFNDMYNEVYNNQKNNITNQKTVRSWQFVSKLFTDFTKTGSLEYSSPATSTGDIQCVHLTNDGLRSIIQPKKDAIAFWDRITENVEKYIVDEF
ncbi:Esterase B1 [Pseudolycoriella hygida]|uniref:Esterase B1 n=1 Tax=Pseudolycoriella hygida TaxID=35572 RepID=A0A9Q0MR91_9DIPT|nr:Esterase B1 [Pseudolycoriella hygida]